MNSKCEWTLNNLPHLLVKEDEQTTESAAAGNSRRVLLEHLRSCPTCQREYETLWQIGDVLESTPAPEPPPELVGKIQENVRLLHRQQQLAFFASPLAWCFGRLKLDFSPRFVNATALLFFLVASGVAVKLAFFTEVPTPELGLTAMERTRLQHVRVSSSPWALIKESERDVDQPQVSPAISQTQDRFFGAAERSSQVWHTEAAGSDVQTVETEAVGYSEDVAREKLTVFWNQIKTEL